MSNDHQHPLDMNAAFKGIAAEVLRENAPQLVGEALVASGNATRMQGYSMMPMKPEMFLAAPALLEGDVSLWLCKFYRPLPNFFNLIVAHTPDGQRTLVATMENEGNTLESKFLGLTPAFEAEINRQLAVLQSTYVGVFHLGLFVQDKPIEGYKYFVDETVVAEAAEVKTEVAADVKPTELAAVVADAAPVVEQAPEPVQVAVVETATESTDSPAPVVADAAA